MVPLFADCPARRTLGPHTLALIPPVSASFCSAAGSGNADGTGRSGRGMVRESVARPLGEGYTVEKQLTGAAVHGGTRIVAHPMKAERHKALRLEWARFSDDVVYSAERVLEDAGDPCRAVG